MSAVTAMQMRALVYLLEQPPADALVHKALVESTLHETQDDLLRAFLAEMHPDLAATVGDRQLVLLRDLYRVEYEQWRDAKIDAGGGAWQGVLWQLAMGEKPAG